MLFLYLYRNIQLQMSLQDNVASIGKAALAGAIAVGIAAGPAEAYPNVNIRNNTPYPVTGTVSYISCSSDNYSVDKDRLWTANGRGSFGWCLVTEISAQVKAGDKVSDATSYSSSGTGYAAFEVKEGGPYGYIVTRP